HLNRRATHRPNDGTINIPKPERPHTQTPVPAPTTGLVFAGCKSPVAIGTRAVATSQLGVPGWRGWIDGNEGDGSHARWSGRRDNPATTEDRTTPAARGGRTPPDRGC